MGMHKTAIEIDERRAVEHLMDLLRIEGLSGSETAVAKEVERKLRAAGGQAAWIRRDAAHRRAASFAPAGHAFETGNLIVRLPGTLRGPARMLSAHMDTVPMCRGAVPVRRGRRIVARGATGVRADNRAGVAALVTIAETILRGRLPHPPLTLLFTVAEEIGLIGARTVRRAEIGTPAVAFNYDGGDPAEIVTGAVGAVKWEADCHGYSAHAGLSPEKGVSAVLIAARAIARAAERGYFGRIIKGRRRGTANAGVLRGGEATNEVTARVFVRGECRSHDRAFLRAIEKEWRAAFAWAAASVRDAEGRQGRVDLRVANDYAAFRLADDHRWVRFAVRVARRAGIEARTRVVDGGLDANPLNALGIPTITLGAGMHHPHSVKEYVDLPEYLRGCRLGLALATEAE
jgi:tripeptide aminopeptidase